MCKYKLDNAQMWRDPRMNQAPRPPHLRAFVALRLNQPVWGQVYEKPFQCQLVRQSDFQKSAFTINESDTTLNQCLILSHQPQLIQGNSSTEDSPPLAFKMCAEKCPTIREVNKDHFHLFQWWGIGYLNTVGKLITEWNHILFASLTSLWKFSLSYW